MKLKVKYNSSFSIPKILPHADDGGDDEIFQDSVGPDEVGNLILSSRCGTTIFPKGSWSETESRYYVSPGFVAEFEGARNAFNSIWGIDFPQCSTGAVESSKGRFGSILEYDIATGRLAQSS